MKTALETAESKLYNAATSHQQSARRLPIPREWERFLGYMESDTRYLVKGPEGTRKSTFMLKTADMCGRLGEVLYVLAEEKLKSGTVQKRERHAKVTLSRVRYLETPSIDEVDALLSTGRFRFCIVDSVNMLKSKNEDEERIMHLWDRHRIVFFYVMQMTKDYKEYKGKADFRHFVDVVIETERRGGKYYAVAQGKNRMRVEKSIDRIEI